MVPPGGGRMSAPEVFRKILFRVPFLDFFSCSVGARFVALTDTMCCCMSMPWHRCRSYSQGLQPLFVLAEQAIRCKRLVIVGNKYGMLVLQDASVKARDQRPTGDSGNLSRTFANNEETFLLASNFQLMTDDTPPISAWIYGSESTSSFRLP